MANKNDKGERKSITSRFQIIMLKCRRRGVDFGFRETMPCGFVAPLRDGLTNLCGYFAGLASVQFEISRQLHRQRERGRGVVFVDRGAENARLDVGRHRVEVVSG